MNEFANSSCNCCRCLSQSSLLTIDTTRDLPLLELGRLLALCQVHLCEGLVDRSQCSRFVDRNQRIRLLQHEGLLLANAAVAETRGTIARQDAGGSHCSVTRSALPLKRF